VLVATHSDRLLDFLSQPAESVVTCTPSKNGTILERPNPEVFNAWLDRYSVSELRVRGQLDQQNAENTEE